MVPQRPLPCSRIKMVHKDPRLQRLASDASFVSGVSEVDCLLPAEPGAAPPQKLHEDRTRLKQVDSLLPAAHLCRRRATQGLQACPPPKPVQHLADLFSSNAAKKGGQGSMPGELMSHLRLGRVAYNTCVACTTYVACYAYKGRHKL